jgi:hypothetical protein
MMRTEGPEQLAFEVLEPPPGGLVALRSRLAARRRPFGWALLPLALAGVALLLMIRPPSPPATDFRLAMALGGGMSTGAELLPDSRATHGLVHVPVANSEVLYYRVLR